MAQASAQALPSYAMRVPMRPPPACERVPLRRSNGSLRAAGPQCPTGIWLICAVPAYAWMPPQARLIGAAWASAVAYSASLLVPASFATSALGAQSVRDPLRKGTWEGQSVVHPDEIAA